MSVRFTRNLLAILAFLFFAPVHAESEDICADCYSEEDARSDLQLLYARLQEEHVNLFARRTKAEYDGHIIDLLGRINGPIHRTEFHLMLQEAMAFGKIGHAKTEAAVTDVLNYARNGGLIVPLSVVYHGNTMITDNWTGQGDELPPGSQIIALGGMPLTQFEARARTIVSADTERLLRSQIELGLPVYLFLIFGPVDYLQIEYIAPDGYAGSHNVAATTFGGMFALQDQRKIPSPDRKPNERIFHTLGEGVFYLQPGPFSATADERGEDGEAYLIEPFQVFVREAFAAISNNEAQDLILDLRDNGGGDASFSDLIIARLVSVPYSHSSRFEVRAGPNTKAVWEGRTPDTETLSGRIATALAATEEGQLAAFELPEIQPETENAFRGRVWVLVNRHSYSNAAVVAALMQDLGIATILGEETADVPTTFGAVESFSLPNSGATIIYPKAFMVRPSGSEEVRGVVPDFTIAPNAVGENEDRMLQAALSHILLSR